MKIFFFGYVYIVLDKNKSRINHILCDWFKHLEKKQKQKRNKNLSFFKAEKETKKEFAFLCRFFFSVVTADVGVNG